LLRDYEILYIVRPDLDEEHVSEAVASVNKLIENVGGNSQKTDMWGRRRLAYEVRHLREGHYVLTDFQVEPARVPEMEATLKISDTVFRHLIVRKPEPSRKKAALARKRAAAAEAAQAQAAPAEAATPATETEAPAAAAEAAPAAAPVQAAPAGEPAETASPAAEQAETAPATEPSAEAPSEMPAAPAPEPAAEEAAAEEPKS
jgi:small subunit ribosomal protein S6